MLTALAEVARRQRRHLAERVEAVDALALRVTADLVVRPGLVLGAFLWRRRAGLIRPGETGIVAGCLTLVILFLLALPFIAARSAFVAQLQVSRLFWMNDLLATVYVVWLATEGVADAGESASDRERTLNWRIRFAGVNLFHVARWRLMEGGRAFYDGEAGGRLASSLPPSWDLPAFLGDRRIPISVIQGDWDYVDPSASGWTPLRRRAWSRR